MIDAAAFHARVMAAASFLAPRLATPLTCLCITGTGQHILPHGFTVEQTIPFAAIPNFPAATVPGHPGRLVQGRLAERSILFLQGRVHFYEGYDAQTITLPVRAMAELGAKVLMITNCAGGLNPAWAAGDLMMISDHINFMGVNPLRGPNREEWGPRFPDLSHAYSRRLMAIADKAAAGLAIPLRRGVYCAIPGPSLETPAETRFLRNCGADAVGMSTVPEVIAAVHGGLEVFGLSIIANVNNPDCMQPILMDEVMARVTEAAESTRRLLTAIINAM
jgi:purine-nucleoside phosphorylase